MRHRLDLQQLMAGRRNFCLATIGRHDVFALTTEAARISGLPYIMDAYRQQAEAIIDA